jgi:ABC-type sugar transport system ATPase subunit
VIDNVFLGIEDQRVILLNRARMKERFAELLDWTGFELPANALVSSLSIAQQQLVELLRAVARDASLIVMDEPSARLSAPEAKALHGVIRSLVERGATVVFVSHFLEEVLGISDDVTVLRDGRLVKTGPARSETSSTLVEAMVGRVMSIAGPDRHEQRLDHREPILVVRDLTQDGVFHDVSFSIAAGEIVGLAGLVGSGRSEVAQAIFGARPWDRGTLQVGEKILRRSTVHAMISAGVVMVPESRKTQGLLLGRSIRENITLAHLRTVARFGFVRRNAERQRAEALTVELGVRHASIEQPISELSGGNQQRVLLARWLMVRPKLIIVDEPTSGVDIGAKFAIHQQLRALAANGVGVLVISSELEEILSLADRVLVLSRGTISAVLTGDEITAHSIMEAAFSTGPSKESSDG